MNDRRSMQNTLLWVVAVVLINALWLLSLIHISEPTRRS